jgi:hypothetical protein
MKFSELLFLFFFVYGLQKNAQNFRMGPSPRALQVSVLLIISVFIHISITMPIVQITALAAINY